jgi:DNA polymerase-3 subunit delta'
MSRAARPRDAVEDERPGNDRPVATPMPWLEAPLARALADVHSHAVLLQGPAGIGQYPAALRLAAAWLCEDDAIAAAQRPCGRCAGCRLVAAGTHPDRLVLVPDAMRAAHGEGAEAGEGEGGAKSKAKPSADIRVEQVRAVVAFGSTTAARGRGKAVVVFPAERMNAVAANALLKTLEEPPGRVRFALATGAPGRLLPTILSRCVSIPLLPPGRDEALAWLGAEGVAAAKGGADLLDASGGRPEAALELHRDGVDGALLRALPDAAGRGDATLVRGLSLPLVVGLLQRLADDALVAACGRQPRHFPQAGFDRFASVRRRDVARLTAWAGALLEAARTAAHPWSAELAREALLQQAALALNPPQNRPDTAASRRESATTLPAR